MANWEIENDSTTNYLRAQDKVAQNPIDFYEDGTINTENLSDSYEFPDTNTLAAIRDAIGDTGSHYVRLKPGVVYKGDTHIELWLNENDGTPRSIGIDARGAAVKYTGSGLGPLDVYQDPNYPPGELELIGGTWGGPGQTVTDSYAIRTNDCFGVKVRPGSLKDAENGILARNYNKWTEAAEFGTMTEGVYRGNKDPFNSGAFNLVRMAGGGSSYPNSNGTSSYRNTDVFIPWGSGADGGGTGLWFNGGANWGGKSLIRGFIPDDGYNARFDDTTTAYGPLWIEGEGGNSNSALIRYDGNLPPVVRHYRFGSGGGASLVEANGSASIWATNGRNGPIALDGAQNGGFGAAGSGQPVKWDSSAPNHTQTEKLIVNPSSTVTGGSSNPGTAVLRLYNNSDSNWIEFNRESGEALAIQNTYDSPVLFKDSSYNPLPIEVGEVRESPNVGEIVDSDTGGNVSVAAGGTTTVSATGATNPTMRVNGDSVIVWAASDPAADYGLDVGVPWWDDSAGNWKFDVTETQGVTSVTVNWRLLGVPR